MMMEIKFFFPLLLINLCACGLETLGFARLVHSFLLLMVGVGGVCSFFGFEVIDGGGIEG